ncbi:glycosyltransferase family 4 protein [Fictibacillus barbaricus]|uniref:Glycosyltransferase involved in cell wall biosynthesis n=1 Tax=Fictibacillus barbaricus TaxID=182136 RepID=A0ABU1TXV2_9BACL|nr:glycosyltransferase family 4 protein [Fictibacillus barbaricus]MDR7072046.1 glycosyltransferase involved in cell wall biosynthesis [Fictibacillus barbaricus]
MAKAKILLVFYLPSGGMETLNRQRCKALQSQGIECHLLYLQNGTGMQNISQIPTYITNKDEEIKQILLNHFDTIIVSSDFPMLQRIRKLGYKGKVIYEIQGLGSFTNAERILTQAKSNVLTYSNGILYPKTQHLIGLIESLYPAHPKYCFHNCFDTSEFSYRRTHQLDYPVVGWVGRLEQNKNWYDFVMFAIRFIKHKPSSKFWMFIDDTLSNPVEKKRFTQMLIRYNLTKHVEILSNIPHKTMSDYFSIIGDSGGFLLSTSKVEGFGYAVIEAMSCRCPVLSSDSDGVKAFITHNDTGKFYQNGNIGSAVNQALDLINNLELRNQIISNALNHLSIFSLEAYAKEFMKILD